MPPTGSIPPIIGTQEFTEQAATEHLQQQSPSGSGLSRSDFELIIDATRKEYALNQVLESTREALDSLMSDSEYDPLENENPQMSEQELYQAVSARLATNPEFDAEKLKALASVFEGLNEETILTTLENVDVVVLEAGDRGHARTVSESASQRNDGRDTMLISLNQIEYLGDNGNVKSNIKVQLQQVENLINAINAVNPDATIVLNNSFGIRGAEIDVSNVNESFREWVINRCIKLEIPKIKLSDEPVTIEDLYAGKYDSLIKSLLTREDKIYYEAILRIAENNKVVISAGNEGNNALRIDTFILDDPKGNITFAGALNRDGTTSSYSSIGEVYTYGDTVLVPEESKNRILIPEGYNIVSTGLDYPSLFSEKPTASALASPEQLKEAQRSLKELNSCIKDLFPIQVLLDKENNYASFPLAQKLLSEHGIDIQQLSDPGYRQQWLELLLPEIREKYELKSSPDDHSSLIKELETLTANKKNETLQSMRSSVYTWEQLCELFGTEEVTKIRPENEFYSNTYVEILGLGMNEVTGKFFPEDYNIYTSFMTQPGPDESPRISQERLYYTIFGTSFSGPNLSEQIAGEQ
jgi:hypothetical protein